jgi:hypothetical protein
VAEGGRGRRGREWRLFEVTGPMRTAILDDYQNVP